MPLVSSSIDVSILQEFFIPNVLQNYNGQSSTMSYNHVPYHLEITTQPCEKFRFRYYSEPGSHGVITGRSATGKAKKIFPTVKFVDPYGTVRRPIIIKASLYTADNNPRQHVLSCLSKNNIEKNQDGACYEVLSKDNSAQFKNLGIFTLKKDEVIGALQQKAKQDLRVFRLSKEQEQNILEEFKSFNLYETKLRFEALYKDDMTPVGCPAVFSDTIYNSKATATGELRICRLSLCKGSVSGEEDMIILCDKIKKDDVEVRFFEKEEDSVIWESYAKFNPNDVHYQVAIPFKTPKYDGVNTHPEILVFIQLYRKSDGKYGDPVPFTYKNDIYSYSKKRKLCEDSLLDDILLLNNFSLPSEFDSNGILPWESEDSSDHSSEALDNSCMSNYVQKDAVNASGSLLNEDVEIEEIRDQFSTFSLRATSTDEPNPVKKYLECFSKSVHNLLKGKDILYFVPSSITIQDTKGNSILQLAIFEKQSLKFIEAVIKLTKEDLVNHRNVDQKTPMHLATQLGNAALLELLLKNGGSPHHSDKQGNNCMHLAVMSNSSKCLETLFNFFPSDQEGFPPEINAENDEGLTALHLSILNDSKTCLEILLKNKADINKPEKKGGKSPLHLAVEKKSPLLEILLSQPNIDTRCQDYKGLTAVDLACEDDEEEENVYDDELMDDKEHLLLFLKEKLKIKTDNSSLQNSIGIEDHKLQKKIESILNKNSDWKRLGKLINFSEEKLKILMELEENPAGFLIEKIMEEKEWDLTEIIKRAGLTHAINLLG